MKAREKRIDPISFAETEQTYSMIKKSYFHDSSTH